MRSLGIIASVVLFAYVKLAAQDSTDVAADTVIVFSERPHTVASDATFRARDLQLLPRSTTQDLLRIVPGLVIAQHAGGGKAEQIFLRGFDADHGTDVSISVDDAPVNMVSHGHGQGYSDLHFVIPEIIDRIELIKGPYLAKHGDLTTAGAVAFKTTDTLANNVVSVDAGSYGYLRGVALMKAHIGTTSAYAGGEITTSRGFFDAPQNLQRLNLVARVYSPLSKDIVLTSSAMHFSSSWNASGQVPDRAVANGTITPFGSIDPNEGGTTHRSSLQLGLEGAGASPFHIKASVINYGFQLYSNFTFYARDSVRGDMIEQTDQRMVYALNMQKSFTSLVNEVGFTTSVGASVRHDNIENGLFYDSVRTRVNTVHASNILQTNVALYGQESIVIGSLSAIIGIRADGFLFQAHPDKVRTSPVNDQRMKSEFIVSPKATITYEFNEQLALFANTGYGFHSNDARVVVTAPQGSTVPRAFGAELGSRWTSSTLSVSAAAWMLDLEQEFVWIGDEGTTEESGRSRRIGLDLEARADITQWLTLGGNATLSRGRLMDNSVGEDFIPLAPTLTLTSYAVAAFTDWRASLRLRHIGSRPANEQNSVVASGFTIVDVTASYALFKNLELNLQCENLLNSSWREAQFDTSSRLRGESEATSEIHFTPGTPISLRMGIAVQL